MSSNPVVAKTTYRSKVDLWLIILFLISIGGASAWLISLGGTYTVKGLIFGLALLIINIVLPTWFLIRCNYTINTENLIIRFGPLNWSIPFNSISQISSSSQLSFSPSLSLKRVKIVYGADREVLISPNMPEKFIRELSLHVNDVPHSNEKASQPRS